MVFFLYSPSRICFTLKYLWAGWLFWSNLSFILFLSADSAKRYIVISS